MKKLHDCLFTLALSATLFGCSQDVVEQEAPLHENHHAIPDELKVADGVLVIEEQSEPDTLKGSLKAEAHGMIGPAHLTIAYHSPAVRGRVIWGGLVAKDQIWVTGAHSATSLQTDHPIVIGGEQIPAGKYALFTIPGEQEWTVIVNRNWNQHLADDYSEGDDVVRFSVKPDTSGQHQERLRYEIVSDADGSGAILLTWDKLKLMLPVSA